MKIGIIRPYEIEYNNQDMIDLDRAIKSLGHTSKRVYIDKIGVSMDRGRIDVTHMVSKNRPQSLGIDCAFLRHLGIIKDYEQFGSRLWSVRAIEQSGTLVMNNLMSWLMASDKLASLSTLAKEGLPVPHTFVTEDMFSAYREMKDEKEVVIKPIRGAMGFGVFRASDPDVAMHIFSYFTNLSKPMYLQRYMEKKGGGDYRVIVIGGRAIGAEFRKGKDWKSNVAQGAIPRKARMDDEMEEIAIKATEVLGLEYAGIDIADTREGYMILETNPTISWQGFKKATKINVAMRLVEHMVKRARE